MASAPSRFCLYGKPFEDLEKGEGVSKKPLAIDQQVVTDEKGRRRFHGAFTGGFSAGYFNTVDTKEGWTPSTFKSSRSMRNEYKEQRPEEFMDSEDFSEYGIAPREIKTRDQFSDETGLDKRSQPGATFGLASTQLQATAERLGELIKPTKQSFGAALLVKMGWRPGRGIGPLMEKSLLAKSIEAHVYGCELPPDMQLCSSKEEGEEGQRAGAAVPDDEMDTPIVVSADDVEAFHFVYKNDRHGLGYKSLSYSAILSENEMLMTTGIPGVKSSRGISGQAFGVGVFEDDDPDVYQTDDLSKYTFLPETLAITSGTADPLSDLFVPMCGKGVVRLVYPPPVVPANFTPRADVIVDKEIVEKHGKLGKLPLKTPEQRRAALGELLSDADRPPVVASSKTVNYRKMFKEDPSKQARFNQFLDYVRRERPMSCPPDLAESQWRQLLLEFVSVLSDDLRRAYEMCKRNAQPMASPAVSRMFAEKLNSKFVKSNKEQDDIATAEVRRDEEEAVRMKMFGPMTRETWPWHPDRHLCKRMGVPNPYPDSHLVGVPLLRRSANPVFMLGSETTADTLQHLAKAEDPKHPHWRKPDHADKDLATLQEEAVGRVHVDDDDEDVVVEPFQKPAMDLFHIVFGVSGSEEEEEDDDAKDDTTETPVVFLPPEPVVEPSTTIATEVYEMSTAELPAVVDSPPRSPTYGPAAPPPASEREEAMWLEMKRHYVLKDRRRNDDDDDKERRTKKEKKREESKRKKKRSRWSPRRRRHSSSSSSSHASRSPRPAASD